MFIFANFIIAVAGILKVLLDGYMWIVIISALITWVNPIL
jgi:YggT family protein